MKQESSTINTIEIEWEDDVSECDDCGPSYADGYTIIIDGKVVEHQKAEAACCGGNHHSTTDAVEFLIRYMREHVYDNNEGFDDGEMAISLLSSIIGGEIKLIV